MASDLTTDSDRERADRLARVIKEGDNLPVEQAMRCIAAQLGQLEPDPYRAEPPRWEPPPPSPRRRRRQWPWYVWQFALAVCVLVADIELGLTDNPYVGAAMMYGVAVLGTWVVVRIIDLPLSVRTLTRRLPTKDNQPGSQHLSLLRSSGSLRNRSQ